MPFITLRNTGKKPITYKIASAGGGKPKTGKLAPGASEPVQVPANKQTTITVTRDGVTKKIPA